jgi:hypothetical protein
MEANPEAANADFGAGAASMGVASLPDDLDSDKVPKGETADVFAKPLPADIYTSVRRPT